MGLILLVSLSILAYTVSVWGWISSLLQPDCSYPRCKASSSNKIVRAIPTHKKPSDKTPGMKHTMIFTLEVNILSRLSSCTNNTVPSFGSLHGSSTSQTLISMRQSMLLLRRAIDETSMTDSRNCLAWITACLELHGMTYIR
jgi:hypothetical protein